MAGGIGGAKADFSWTACLEWLCGYISATVMGFLCEFSSNLLS